MKKTTTMGAAATTAAAAATTAAEATTAAAPTTPPTPQITPFTSDSTWKPRSQSHEWPEPITLAVDRDLWARQDGEADLEWGCFTLYRDIHPSIRSVAKAYAAYMALQETTAPNFDESLIVKAPVWFDQICSRNRWVQRVREYDDWRDEDTLRRLQSTQVRFLVETAEVGRLMRSRAAEALAVLRAVAHEIVVNEDGTTTTVEVPALSTSAITALAKTGTDLEREALDIPRAGSAGDGRGALGLGVQVNIANFPGGPGVGLPNPHSDEQLLERLLEISKAKATAVDGQDAQAGSGSLLNPRRVVTRGLANKGASGRGRARPGEEGEK